jgi:phage/plasmid-associated DNA primase
LNWALEGLAAYLKQGLDPPKAVLASTEDYRADMDVVGQWIDERCERDPNATVLTSVAYRDYAQWAADEVGWELKKLSFRRHLSDRGFGAEKGTHGQRMIRGLRLKPITTSEQSPAANGGPPWTTAEQSILTAATIARANDSGHVCRTEDRMDERLRALLEDQPSPPTGGGGGGREAFFTKSS